MDFGLARGATEAGSLKPELIGTMAYLSPEQVIRLGADGRSDVCSLGTVLYECLVGEPPFSGETNRFSIASFTRFLNRRDWSARR